MRAEASARTAASWVWYSATSALGGLPRRVGVLVTGADARVAGLHPLLHARVQHQPHEHREHDERAGAPDELLELGRDRARAVLRLDIAVCFTLLGGLVVGDTDDSDLDGRAAPLGGDGNQHVSSFGGIGDRFGWGFGGTNAELARQELTARGG